MLKEVEVKGRKVTPQALREAKTTSSCHLTAYPPWLPTVFRTVSQIHNGT